MTKTDQELIADYVSGADENAINVLINRHLKLVYNFSYKLVGNAEDAEEITQETFVKIWKNIEKYKKGQSFKAWLMKIARNTAIDLLRKKKSFSFSDFETSTGENLLVDTLADSEPGPMELTARSHDGNFLNDILENLSQIYKEVIVLRYQDGMTFEEIAKFLDKPLDTVKSQHRRALIRIRQLMETLAPNYAFASYK
jgi:RNA polymerase sigma-70 factor (ECF subfamily)